MPRRAGLAILAPVLAGMMLAGCAGGGPGGSGAGRGPAPALVAQPGEVVAVELAFARAAREKGQWTAFAEYATRDALMFVPQPVNAQQWLKGRANPAEASRWQVHQVWSSCDGSLAASSGAFQQADGAHGRFVTLWQRQDKGGYKWVADMGERLEVPLEEPDMVQAQVADCPQGAARGMVRGSAARPSTPQDSTVSHDRTLAYSWASNGASGTVLTVRMMRDGEMREVLTLETNE